MAQMNDTMAVVNYFKSEIDRLHKESDRMLSDAMMTYADLAGMENESVELPDDELIDSIQRAIDTDMLNDTQKVLAIRTMIESQ